MAVVWKHPPQVLRSFPNLKLVSSLGAGVEHILNDLTFTACPADHPHRGREPHHLDAQLRVDGCAQYSQAAEVLPK